MKQKVIVGSSQSVQQNRSNSQTAAVMSCRLMLCNGIQTLDDCDDGVTLSLPKAG